MSYRVTLWNAQKEVSTQKHYLTRPQAIHGMRKLAYHTLEWFAKLDTAAAHDVMARIERCDDILPPQDQRRIVISNTGYELTISNTARAAR